MLTAIKNHVLSLFERSGPQNIKHVKQALLICKWQIQRYFLDLNLNEFSGRFKSFKWTFLFKYFVWLNSVWWFMAQFICILTFNVMWPQLEIWDNGTSTQKELGSKNYDAFCQNFLYLLLQFIRLLNLFGNNFLNFSFFKKWKVNIFCGHRSQWRNNVDFLEKIRLEESGFQLFVSGRI